MTGWFLVLTASAGVPQDWAQKTALATGGGPRRLGPGAVEIAVFDPSAAEAAREELFDAPVDVNVVAAEGRRKKLLIADMDSTIIPVECIDEIADFAGVKDRVADITERAMRGELNFEAALKERVGMLAGLPESALEAAYRERVSLNPGARALVGTMNRAGAMTALVSGGFTFFTSRVAAAAGFRYNQANRLVFADGKLTGEVAEPILGREAKLEALKRLCADAGIGTDAAIAVGDGANDLSMVKTAGLGVAYHAKPALEAGADARLRHSDLRALLHLQGYADAEIVEAR